MKQNLKKEKKENNTEETVKKVNFFHLFTIITIVLLVIAIICEIIVIIVFNNRIDDTQNQIDNIPDASQTFITESLPEINQIEDICDIMFIDV